MTEGVSAVISLCFYGVGHSSPLGVGIGCKEIEYEAWSSSGIGDVPERYRNPYTFTLTEEEPSSSEMSFCGP